MFNSFMKLNYFQFIQHITFNNDRQFQPKNMNQNNMNTIQNPNQLTLSANLLFQLHLIISRHKIVHS